MKKGISGFVLQLILGAGVIMLTSYLFEGVYIKDFSVAFLVAIVLTLLNKFIKPILKANEKRTHFIEYVLTCHKEEEERYPELLYTILTRKGLIQQTDNTQDKGQHIAHVATGVLGHIVGKKRSIAHAELIDKVKTTYPVTFIDLTMTLQIVLTAGEVPQEISPIHVIELIIKEELHVLCKGGLHTGRSSRPLTIGRYVIRLATVHAGEEHLRLALIDVSLFLAGNHIAIALLGGSFDSLLIDVFTLFNLSFTIHAFHLRHECLAIQQGSFAILLAVEVATECKDILGRVLVHRSIGSRAYEDKRIR